MTELIFDWLQIRLSYNLYKFPVSNDRSGMIEK